jgi:hypothetical protein
MPGSRQTQQTIALILVGVVLSVVAIATDVPDLVILILFVVAALVTHFAWPDKSSDD